MAVILANCVQTANIYEHPIARDTRGQRVKAAATLVESRGPFPGAAVEPTLDKGPTGGGWRLRCDPRMHPLNPGDTITDDRGRVFVLREARLVAVPGASDVDFIQCVADLDPPLKA